MPTMKEQVESAKAYIKAKQYDDARRILKQVDHPIAKKWLAKIDELSPPENVNSPRNLVRFWVQLGVSMFLAWIVAGVLDNLENIVNPDSYFTNEHPLHISDNMLIVIWVVLVILFLVLLIKISQRWLIKNKGN